jgi:hypothetical protein
MAVTLVEALTGVPPFGDEATWDTGPRWRRARRPGLPADLPSLPTQVREVLAGALAARPADRPSVAEVAAALTPVASE